jgi:all-trans-8'-apo-beta-carotenal 15,15'-oxygenase
MIGLPSSISGVLYRIGPGRFERGGHKYAHPLDGDGRVDRIEIHQGRVSDITSRFVETREYTHEQKLNVINYRGAFGTGRHISLRKLKNPANTALINHNNTLLAMWEGAWATRIDPVTLKYLGPFDFGGSARVAPAFSFHPMFDRAMGLGGDAVCAHPRRCPKTGNLVVLMTRFSLNSTTLRFVEFAPGTWRHAGRVTTYTIEGFTHLHSFGVTDKSIVFFQPPLSFDVHGFRKGASALDAVQQHDGPVKLVQLARYTGTECVTEVPRLYATHIVNAYDTPYGCELDFFATDQIGKNMKLEFAPWHLRGGARVPAQLDMLMGEFPCIPPELDGKFNRFFYYSGCSKPGEMMDAFVKIDRTTGLKRSCASPGALHTEPVFIPACNGCREDEGFLLGIVLADRRCYLKAVDARTMRQAGIIPVDGVNPTGLHSLWVQ